MGLISWQIFLQKCIHNFFMFFNQFEIGNCWIIPMVRDQIKVRHPSIAKRFLIPTVKNCENEILKFRWHCPLKLFCFSFKTQCFSAHKSGESEMCVQISTVGYPLDNNHECNYLKVRILNLVRVNFQSFHTVHSLEIDKNKLSHLCFLYTLREMGIFYVNVDFT